MVIGRRLTESELATYDIIAPELSRKVRIVAFPVLPPRASAMTVGSTILVRPARRGDAVLLAHELVHVRQWAELGRLGFLRRYLTDYGQNLVRLRRHRAAYLAIPLESEARSEAHAWRDRRPED
jgi:hypothetical protein